MASEVKRDLGKDRIEVLAWAKRCDRHDGNMRACRYQSGEPCACHTEAAAQEWQWA